MTKKAYKGSDGKLAILSTRIDECLWSGQWWNGVEQSRFDELYVHKTKAGRNIFYIAHVTYWQSESNSVTVLDGEDEYIDAGMGDITGWVTANYGHLSDQEIARLAELGVKLEETA